MFFVTIWTVLIVVLARYSVSIAMRNYHSRLDRCVPLTPGNAWLLAFGARVVEPPNIAQYLLAWFLVWIVGAICLAN